MKKIYLYAAHTSFSPGGMLEGRTEHGDTLRFCRFLAEYLKSTGIADVGILKGNIRPCPDKDAFVIIFHRDYNEGNDRSYGAAVYVAEDADCTVQYTASRLLESISRNGGFRYKGVHFGKNRCGFSELEKTGCKNTFLLTLGYIDSQRDNFILDEKISFLAEALCEEITDILKETEYENRTRI